MPAAAVIPAPIAYIKVVAVKKLVVELRARLAGPPYGVYLLAGPYLLVSLHVLYWVCRANQDFYFEKIRVFKAGLRPNTLAWNNRIGRAFSFCWFLEIAVMINRDSWGHLYSVVRGEILGLPED